MSDTPVEQRLDRKALMKRMEARQNELAAKIREAEASAARAASSHVQVWKTWLSEIEDGMAKGLDKLRDDVVERLDDLVSRPLDDVESSKD